MRVSAVQRRVIGIIIDWDQPTQHSMAGNSGSPRFSSHPRILLVNLTFALKKPRERDSDSGGKEGEGRGDNLLPPAPDRRTDGCSRPLSLHGCSIRGCIDLRRVSRNLVPIVVLFRGPEFEEEFSTNSLIRKIARRARSKKASAAPRRGK